MSEELKEALDDILKLGEIVKSAADLKTEAENNGKDVAPVVSKSRELLEDLKKSIGTIEGKLERIPKAKAEPADDDTVEQPPNRPLIKVVDINKLLVKPSTMMKSSLSPTKEKKSVQFDSSVIIIDSSGDEGGSRRASRSNRNSSPRRSPKPKSKQVRSDSSDNEMSDRESAALPRKARNGRRNSSRSKKYKVPDTSDSSSSESSEGIISRPSPKSKKPQNIKRAKEIDRKNDRKLKADCAVDLLRVPCEAMKQFYDKLKEDQEFDRLTNLSSLKKCWRSRKTKSPVTEEKETVEQNGSDSKKSEEKMETLDKSNSDRDDEKKLESNDGKSDESDLSIYVTPSETFVVENDESAVALSLDLLKSDEEKSKSDKEDKDAPGLSLNEESTKNDSQTPKKRRRADKCESSSDSDKQSEKKKKETEEHNEVNEPAEPVINNDDKDETDDVPAKSVDKSKEDWKNDKLLTEKLSSSDSDEQLSKFRKKKAKMEEKAERGSSDDDVISPPIKKKTLRQRAIKKKPVIEDSDSEDGADKKKKNSDDDYDSSKKDKSSSSSSSSSDFSSEDEKSKLGESSKKPLKRVRRMKDSSSDDSDKSTRKQIRKVWGRDSLAESTLKAEEEEKQRKARLAEKQKKYNQIFDLGIEARKKVDKVVLDFDDKTNEELLKVDERIVEKLKPHQAAGVRFMWEACFESLERASKTKGSGCILAHCMGLGKTLQVIALIHTLLTNEAKTTIKRVMVVCPLSTVLNWVNEFKLWLPDEDDLDVYELVSFKQNFERQYQMKQWHQHGGVLIIGYDMFRNLTNPTAKRHSKKMQAVFQETLLDPGPDLVVCDEGHLLKNEKTNLSVAMNRLRTMRRIVLTGTPLQNNLKEYFCMVQFIKPSLLGTYKEYLNRFVNPITNGQYTDSTPNDILIMRKRSHVLHRMLDGVVQRRDYSVLAPYLPPKHEYVLFLRLSETQVKLYDYYMTHLARQSSDGSNRTSFLFVDFQAFQRICTHPRVLLDKSNEVKAKGVFADDDSEGSQGSLKDFIDDENVSSSDTSTSKSGSGSDSDDLLSLSVNKKKRVTRGAIAKAIEDGEKVEEVIDLSEDVKEWWQDICDGDELDNLAHSSKLVLLFEILKECEQIGDKVLLFSQSLYSLNVIEYFLDKVQNSNDDVKNSMCGYSGSWCLGLDYFRLDGSSSCDNRSAWCKIFNNPKNTRARLFLISTRAGGLGINLTGANRVIIFDVSWNPSHDIQSIYRVYRFGQTKPCYIYRFVTHGTMEMKIYERQVTKQAISKRVIDEQQIDRHYNSSDLQELYRFEPDPGPRPIPLVPKDVLLGELLQKFEDRIYKYHEHQTLLENKEEEGLNEEERKVAWEEFENEKKARVIYGNMNMPGMTGLPPPPDMTTPTTIVTALKNIIRRQNPSWTEAQLNQVAPTFLTEMQAEMERGERLLQNQVQREIQSMYEAYNRRVREIVQQQQAMKLYQQQLKWAQTMAAGGRTQNGPHADGGAGPSQQYRPDVIDLND